VVNRPHGTRGNQTAVQLRRTRSITVIVGQECTQRNSARRSHNPWVAGSSPAAPTVPPTIRTVELRIVGRIECRPSTSTERTSAPMRRLRSADVESVRPARSARSAAAIGRRRAAMALLPGVHAGGGRVEPRARPADRQAHELADRRPPQASSPAQTPSGSGLATSQSNAGTKRVPP